MDYKGLGIQNSFSRWRGWKYVGEVAFIAGVYFLYMVVRKFLIPNIEPVAFGNATRIISFESAAGFFWEPGWQSWAIEHSRALVVFLNWAYVVTFAPMIVITAVVMYVKDRPKYFYYRNIILLSFAIALTIFALFPLAPPRFMPEYGFVDAIHRLGGSLSWYGGSEFAQATYYNVYAAMPSLHFGWTVLFGVLFIRMDSWWLKAWGFTYPTLTFFAITVTGNHYILDAVGGGGVALSSFLLYEGIIHLRRRAPVPMAAARARLAVVPAYFHATFLRWKARWVLAVALPKPYLRPEGSFGKRRFFINIPSLKAKRT